MNVEKLFVIAVSVKTKKIFLLLLTLSEETLSQSEAFTTDAETSDIKFSRKLPSS